MYTITRTDANEFQLWNGKQRDTHQTPPENTADAFFWAWEKSLNKPHLALRLWNAAAILHRTPDAVALTGNEIGNIGTVTNEQGRIYRVTSTPEGIFCGYSGPVTRHQCPDHEHNHPEYCKHQLAVMLALQMQDMKPAEDDPADCYFWDGLDFETEAPQETSPRKPAADPFTIPAPGWSKQARTGNYLATRARVYREMEESRRAMPRQAQATGPHF